MSSRTFRQDKGLQHRVTGGRVGPPTSGVPGSLYDFVRRHLVANGGTCSREDLLAALQSDPVIRERLARGRGFRALVNNMRFSGDVTLDRDRVTATSRTYRRLNIVPHTP
jgi:hypothetical protein